MATSFYRERARVIDGAIRRLKQDKRVFATLERHAGDIEAAGNVLAGDNQAIAEGAGRSAFLVQRLATRKGPVSDAVKKAAERANATGNYAAAVGEVVEAVRAYAESGALGDAGGQTGTPVDEGRDASEDAALGEEPSPGVDEEVDAADKVKIDPVSVTDAHKGEMFGDKVLRC